MKLRIKYEIGNWIMWGYGGRVLYPFILFKHKQKDVPDWLFRHEMQHIYQIKKLGWWKFHLIYFWYLAKGGYNNHPFEIEAKKHQHIALTNYEKDLKRL